MKKKALLIVSFGTAYVQTRKKTIEAVEQELARAFPEYEPYRAWTSPRIRAKVKKEEGLEIASLEEALQRIAADGYTEVLVQITCLLKALEYEKALATLKAHAGEFTSLRLGAPLLAQQEDLVFLSEILPEVFSQVEKSDRLIFMGHGTPKGDNSQYFMLEKLLHGKGYSNFRMALVEAKPQITDLLEEMKGQSIAHVYLAPFMIVAGNHALVDMSGDSEDSWEHLLEKEGYSVTCILQGLGEYEKVRQLFVQHAKTAEADAACEVQAEAVQAEAVQAEAMQAEVVQAEAVQAEAMQERSGGCSE